MKNGILHLSYHFSLFLTVSVLFKCRFVTWRRGTTGKRLNTMKNDMLRLPDHFSLFLTVPVLFKCRFVACRWGFPWKFASCSPCHNKSVLGIVPLFPHLLGSRSQPVPRREKIASVFPHLSDLGPASTSSGKKSTLNKFNKNYEKNATRNSPPPSRLSLYITLRYANFPWFKHKID